MSLTGPDARIPDDLLSSAYTLQATVESWLGDEYLGEVPVEDGSVAWDATQQVQGSLSLTVPRVGAAGRGAPSAQSLPRCAATEAQAPYRSEQRASGGTWSLFRSFGSINGFCSHRDAPARQHVPGYAAREDSCLSHRLAGDP